MGIVDSLRDAAGLQGGGVVARVKDASLVCISEGRCCHNEWTPQVARLQGGSMLSQGKSRVKKERRRRQSRMYAAVHAYAKTGLAKIKETR